MTDDCINVRQMPPATPPPGGDPLIVAHRGAWSEAPQNSPAALEAAIELGCDMVELDVRRTRDGRLVVIHDARVAGTPIAALEYDQLADRLGPRQAAPRLEELLEPAAGRIALDVELKEDDCAQPALEMLAARLPGEHYVITSFLDSALAAVLRAAPEIRTGLLLRPGRRPRALERRLSRTGADFLVPHASLARAGLLAWAANRGLSSYVWTVNDVRTLRTLLADVRVGAVITDRPARALTYRGQGAERRRSTPRPRRGAAAAE